MESNTFFKKNVVVGIIASVIGTAVIVATSAHYISARSQPDPYRTGKALPITYGSGQRYDFWVYNEQNEEIYRWSNNKAFTQALIEHKLKKSEQLAFEETWNLLDNEGNPVPPGTYTIKVMIMIGSDSETIHPDELSAQTKMDI